MKPKKTNKQFLRDLSNRTLQPLIDHCEANRGAMSEVTRRLNESFPQPVALIQVSNWLNKDAKKRTVAPHPAVEMLLEVWGEIKKEAK